MLCVCCLLWPTDLEIFYSHAVAGLRAPRGDHGKELLQTIQFVSHLYNSTSKSVVGGMRMSKSVTAEDTTMRRVHKSLTCVHFGRHDIQLHAALCTSINEQCTALTSTLVKFKAVTSPMSKPCSFKRRSSSPRKSRNLLMIRRCREGVRCTPCACLNKPVSRRPCFQ